MTERLFEARKRVIIESPYAGDIERNMKYLEEAVLDSLKRGEAPFASHGFYTAFLNDQIPEQRKQGIECGFAWQNVAELVVFYADLGFSNGMKKAQERVDVLGLKYEVRYIR